MSGRKVVVAGHEVLLMDLIDVAMPHEVRLALIEQMQKAHNDALAAGLSKAEAMARLDVAGGGAGLC
jgi:hypothetical protein